MTDQAVAVVLAWSLVISLFLTDILLAVRRAHVPWGGVVMLAVGSLLLALASAVELTNILAGRPLSQPLIWFVIVARALAGALFVGTLMRLTLRPRWLIRRMDKWLT